MTILMKAVTLLFWIIAFFAWQQDWQGTLSWLPITALIIAAVHVLEVLFFVFSLRQKSNNVALDAIQIFVFGMPHLQRFMPRAKTK
ncbi:MAG: DUF1145 domain-containing protein [Oleibacter sp.]|nr:DUF1145 domain-containing protein [Thalassolituus sp.]